jgi:hypothetical protein
MPNPSQGGRFYLIDGEHVPAEEVELPSDPYKLRAICGAMWPDAAESTTDVEEAAP